jgi:hypothetical protein
MQQIFFSFTRTDVGWNLDSEGMIAVLDIMDTLEHCHEGWG